MVKFDPFPGYTPQLDKNERMIDRVSPPYDVINAEEQRAWQSHPHNVTLITLGGIDGDYSKAGSLLTSWIDKGALKQETTASYFLYKQEFQENGEKKVRLGLVGALKAEGYSPEGVIPHEETFPKVKEDRLNLLRGTQTHCESIFGLVDDFDHFEEMMLKHAEPVLQFVDGSGVEHSLSRIDHPETLARIKDDLSRKKMLIADGHHRYETACKYALENTGQESKGYVLATIVSSKDPGLIVRPTHRLITGLGDEVELLRSLSIDFALAKAFSKDDLMERMAISNGRDLGLATRSGELILLRPKKEGVGELENLDTYVCEERIIKPLVLSKEGAKVSYDHDLESAFHRLEKGEFEQVILLSPPSLDTIWSVALDGRKMPKKSTYFWPKMWSGLVCLHMR
jgi:uncharacterized protein (DUF1015 family)